jgi:hypothetical protein
MDFFILLVHLAFLQECLQEIIQVSSLSTMIVVLIDYTFITEAGEA